MVAAAETATNEVVAEQRKIGYKSPPPGWKPGQSGNPKGRPSAGAAVKEWINQMRDWSLEEVRAVMADSTSSVTKMMAARATIDACSQERNASGSPIAGPDLDRIIEHTDGKAIERTELTGPDGGPIETVVKDNFDHDRYAELYRLRTGRNRVGLPVDPANGS